MNIYSHLIPAMQKEVAAQIDAISGAGFARGYQARIRGRLLKRNSLVF
jgi:hypothetical protein